MSISRPGRAIVALLVSGGVGACGVDPESDGQELAGPAADYVVAELTEPPSAAQNAAAFSISVTVRNVGDAAAIAASTTRYYLSADPVAGGDRAFAQSTAVAPLGVGASDTRTVTLVIPTGLTGGSYHVLACADRGGTVPESNNANNCAASTGLVAVTGPDLTIDVVADPPRVLRPGATFAVTDTTRNGGTAQATPSVLGYFLSPQPVRAPGARRLSGQRATGPIAAGATSSGAATLRVPTMAPGLYYLVACADIAAVVGEVDENNNCAAASGTTTIPGPSTPLIESVATADGYTQLR